jgi:hypothetical protein
VRRRKFPLVMRMSIATTSWVKVLVASLNPCRTFLRLFGAISHAKCRIQEIRDGMLSLRQAMGRYSSRELTESQLLLKQMVLNSVTALNTRRNYSKSLGDLFAFAAGRPLTRALLQEWKTSLDGLAASTVNVKLAAARRLVSEFGLNQIRQALTKFVKVLQTKSRGGIPCLCDSWFRSRLAGLQLLEGDAVWIHQQFSEVIRHALPPPRKSSSGLILVLRPRRIQLRAGTANRR